MSGGITALVADYIALRRGLGYHSPSQERALRAFARYLDQSGHDGPIPLEASLIGRYRRPRRIHATHLAG
jgi:hypothetical protein